MPSRINSTTTSPGGLISTGDSDNNLLIQTGDTTAITINNTQQVSLTNPLGVASGGTGATTRQAAMDALAGAVTAGRYLRGDGTDVIMDTLKAADMTGIIAVANGGTGTSTPSLVAGTNISISGTWPNQTITGTAGAPTTAQVLSATAGATAGAVGTYAYAGQGPQAYLDVGFGSTISGAGLKPASGTSIATASPTLTGTWRCMGESFASANDNARPTLWLRIS